MVIEERGALRTRSWVAHWMFPVALGLPRGLRWLMWKKYDRRRKRGSVWDRKKS